MSASDSTRSGRSLQVDGLTRDQALHLAYQYGLRKQYPEALKVLKRTIRAGNQKCPRCWADLAFAWVAAKGDAQMAYEAVKRAMTVQPGAEYRPPSVVTSEDASVWPPADKARGKHHGRSDPLIWFVMAKTYIISEDPAERVEKSLLQSLRCSKQFRRAEVLHLLAGQYRKQGKLVKCVKTIDLIAHEGVPPPNMSVSDVFFELGSQLIDMSMHEHATDALRKATELDSSHAQASKLMAWLLLQRAESLQSEAGKAATRAIEADEADSGAQYLLGRVASAQNNPSKSFQAYKAAIELDAANWKAWASLGVLYHRLNLTLQALEVYRTAIKFNSKRVEIWVNLASAQHALGRYDEALATLKKAMAQFPTAHAKITKAADAIRSLGRTTPPDRRHLDVPLPPGVEPVASIAPGSRSGKAGRQARGGTGTGPGGAGQVALAWGSSQAPSAALEMSGGDRPKGSGPSLPGSGQAGGIISLRSDGISGRGRSAAGSTAGGAPMESGEIAADTPRTSTVGIDEEPLESSVRDSMMSVHERSSCSTASNVGYGSIASMHSTRGREGKASWPEGTAYNDGEGWTVQAPAGVPGAGAGARSESATSAPAPGGGIIRGKGKGGAGAASSSQAQAKMLDTESMESSESSS